MPGTGVIPCEFYKSFREEVTSVHNKVFNYALQSGDPPKSWSKAIISVLHKDPTLCEGYRPVSLLYNDLKILTSIMEKQMQKYITTLIKIDQTGFIPGRQGANNRRILNIISSTKCTFQASMMVRLDTQRSFLYQTLLAFGFHQNFIKWVKKIYKDPKSRTGINGYCSDFFNLKRGVRQGDCLSPLLFALSIEPLAELVRQNSQILGKRDEGGVEHNMSLFADDLLIILSDPSL